MRAALIALVLIVATAAAAENRTAPALSFTRVGSLATPRTGPALVALADGRVLVVGGSSVANAVPLPSTEIWEPATTAFANGPMMRMPRFKPAAAQLDDGRVLVVGGTHSSFVLIEESAELLSLKDGSSRLIDGPTVPRGAHHRLIRSPTRGRRLVIAGTQDRIWGTATDSIEEFDPLSERFADWGRLLAPRTSASLLRLDGRRLLVAGGDYRCCDHPLNRTVRESQEIFDLVARESSRLEPLPAELQQPENLIFVSPREGPALAACNRQLARLDGDERWELLKLAQRPFSYLLPLGDRWVLGWGMGGGTLIDPAGGESWPIGPPETVQPAVGIALEDGCVLLLLHEATGEKLLEDGWLACLP